MFLQAVEESISALEKYLGVSITIVDNQGAFMSPAGRLIFSLSRKSHRKSLACKADFCDKCIQHCRHAMNARAEANPEVFIETCWKGITEIVAPLNSGGVHLGMLYAGAWRKPEVKPLKELSRKFKAEFRKLPLYNQAEIDAIKSVIRVFARGLVDELHDSCALSLPEDSRVGQIRKFFQKSALKPVMMSDLCESLGLSRSRISYLLKKYFGKNFQSMLNEVRINRAKALLIGGDDTVAIIAAKVGFGDEYHFSRIFKKITGLPPGQFRKIADENKP